MCIRNSEDILKELTSGILLLCPKCEYEEEAINTVPECIAIRCPKCGTIMIRANYKCEIDDIHV